MQTAFDPAAVAQGLRTGNRTAWHALYEKYSVDVWRYVARLLGADQAAVADVVQEVFLAAAGSARNFDATRGTLWTWLTGIAHHQVAAHWKQASRAARIQQLAMAQATEIQHWLVGEQPLDALWERRELADLVRSVLAELPAEHAALLTGKYLDEQSLACLSEQTGSSQEAVKSKLARARREFRSKFERFVREPNPLPQK